MIDQNDHFQTMNPWGLTPVVNHVQSWQVYRWRKWEREAHMHATASQQSPAGMLFINNITSMKHNFIEVGIEHSSMEFI